MSFATREPPPSGSATDAARAVPFDCTGEVVVEEDDALGRAEAAGDFFAVVFVVVVFFAVEVDLAAVVDFFAVEVDLAAVVDFFAVGVGFAADPAFFVAEAAGFRTGRLFVSAAAGSGPEVCGPAEVSGAFIGASRSPPEAASAGSWKDSCASVTTPTYQPPLSTAHRVTRRVTRRRRQAGPSRSSNGNLGFPGVHRPYSLTWSSHKGVSRR
ncbi:hypothetical protein [Microbacterium gorillae]|uniref:hypothetical protein n=1 Tax=Microbacterium gorillae TaxID=1231063 RepID=UPI000693AD22|nr:hypothetical protein [Microbacterium gorillae]